MKDFRQAGTILSTSSPTRSIVGVPVSAVPLILDTLELTTKVSTTNGPSDYWVLTATAYDATETPTVLGVVNTSGDPVGQSRDHSLNLGQTFAVGGLARIDVVTSKVGSPSTLTLTDAAVGRFAGKTAAVMGDSLCNLNGHGFEVQLAARMGWTITHLDGVGGSGFCNGYTFLSRLPALLASHPDVVVIEGGTNDHAYDPVTVFMPAVRAFFAALRAGFDGPIYVTGSYRIDQPWFDQLVRASEEVGAMFTDWGDWANQPRTTIPPGRRWFTGTGDVNHLQGNGNRDWLMGYPGNDTHYGPFGADEAGDRWAEDIMART